MEDILASIRRIIADDQGAAATADGEDDPFDQAMGDDDDMVDDVLDLAEVGERVAPKAADLELEQDDISFLDADGQIDFDSIGVEDQPEEEELEGQDAVDAAFAAMGDVEDDEEEDEQSFEEVSFQPEPEPVFAPAPSQRFLDEDRLLSAATDAAVGNAFNTLAHTVLSNNGRTLDDLVKELLRPMLKGWLDDNLPTIVERLVRSEIERVSRGGR